MVNTYKKTQVKNNLEGLYVILTDGNKMTANIAIVSDVEIVNNNELILDVTGCKTELKDGIFINVDGLFYKLSFKTIITNITKDILKTYMNIHRGVIDYNLEVFGFCRSKDVVKQVRKSNTGGAFVDWYNADRKTDCSISSYDGIWFNENYLRILPVIPSSSEFNMSGKLFEIFNEDKPITSMGEYQGYRTINDIVIPSLVEISLITNDKIIAKSTLGREFVIYINDKNKDSIITA